MVIELTVNSACLVVRYQLVDLMIVVNLAMVAHKAQVVSKVYLLVG